MIVSKTNFLSICQQFHLQILVKKEKELSSRTRIVSTLKRKLMGKRGGVTIMKKKKDISLLYVCNNIR